MKEALSYYGLSDNEIRVYLAILKLGESSVTEIANKANIYRTLTYEVLKSLEDKGLVSSVIRQKKKFFLVATPKKLVAKLREKERKIQEIMPELLALHKSVTVKPTMTVYTGREGLKTIFEDILITNKEFLGIGSVKIIANRMQTYIHNFIKKRIEQKMHARLLLDKKPIAKKLTDYRLIKEQLPTISYIYGNKVAVLNLGKELIGMIIENEDYTKSQRILFEMMWKNAKKP